jgi:protein-disulfide isomerase
MARRIFFILIVLGAVYLAYDIFRLASAQRHIAAVEAQYTLTPEGADLDVVEFLDYSCKYCKEAHPTITKAVAQDGKVRYIPRPMDSEGPGSLYGAEIVYAAARQGKFMEMHNAVMENFRVINDDVLAELAAQTGVDLAKLKADLESPAFKQETQNTIKANKKIFGALRGKATPTFVIGGNIIYVPEVRMPEAKDFLAMFKEARGISP